MIEVDDNSSTARDFSSRGVEICVLQSLLCSAHHHCHCTLDEAPLVPQNPQYPGSNSILDNNLSRHTSSVARNFFTPSSSTPSPSESAFSIHRAAAMTCFGSWDMIHTRPFTPTAQSRGNLLPRRGRRKCLGSCSLVRETVVNENEE